MRAFVLLPALLLAFVACRPKPKPPAPPGDTTAVDTTLLDTAQAALDAVSEDELAPVTAADTLVARGQRRAAAPATTGTPIGMSAWPTARFCEGPVNEVTSVVTPAYLGGYLRAAEKCGVHVWVSFQRKAQQGSGNHFSVSQSKDLVDEYVRRTGYAEIQRQSANGTLLGFIVLDDVRCRSYNCWGGVLIPQSDAAQVMIYARSRFPAALFIRVTPDWIAAYNGWQGSVDGGWVQYLAAHGDPVRYYTKQSALAQKIGINLAMGVSSADCRTINSMVPCTDDQLKQFFKVALDDPWNCSANGWRYYDNLWARSDLRAAWAWVADYAKTKTPHSCRRP